MIYFNIRLSNPFTKDDEYYKTKSIFGRLSKNKNWEIELHNSPDNLFCLGCDIGFRRSHSGICIWFGLFRYWFSFEIYDSRHWDYKNNCWESVEEK